MRSPQKFCQWRSTVCLHFRQKLSNSCKYFTKERSSRNALICFKSKQLNTGMASRNLNLNFNNATVKNTQCEATHRRLNYVCFNFQHAIRALALKVLREILRHQPARFRNYAELTIMKTLEAHKDPHKEVCIQLCQLLSFRM